MALGPLIAVIVLGLSKAATNHARLKSAANPPILFRDFKRSTRAD
jgi:hypothetical protein